MFRRLLLTIGSSQPRSISFITLQPRRYFCVSKVQTELLQQVQAKVFEVLRSAAKCDQSKLSKTATFEQLGFDSLDSVEIVVAMEQNMGIDIPNQEAQKIGTVEAAINTFYRLLNEKNEKAKGPQK